MIETLSAMALASLLTSASAECPTATRDQIARVEAAASRSEAIAVRDRVTAMFDEIVIPEGDWRSPPTDAPVMFRVVAPPGGGHSNTIWTVVWREADGSWWFWKQDRHSGAASPPERPPEGTPEYEAHMARWYGGPLADVDRWPPEGGRLNARQAGVLDAALNDPCRAAAGPFWPGEVPLAPVSPAPGVPPIPPPPPPPPVPDSSPVYVQLIEVGAAPRYLGAFWPGDVNRIGMISAAAWPQPE
jgi:hypothetical protein